MALPSGDGAELHLPFAVGVVHRGGRTGKFRPRTDRLLADANGKSWISLADYAIAPADEIERPAHQRQRFTVGC
jgi:putative NADH-flavin reductase